MINVSLQPVKATLGRYGKDKQLVVAIEELSELQKELCKALRNKPDREHIIEETADVLIMVANVREIFQIRDDEISGIVKKKQNRTIKRMERGESYGKSDIKN